MSISKKVVIGALTVSVLGASQLGGHEANAAGDQTKPYEVNKASNALKELGANINYDDAKSGQTVSESFKNDGTVNYYLTGEQAMKKQFHGFRSDGTFYYPRSFPLYELTLADIIEESGETVDPDKIYHFEFSPEQGFESHIIFYTKNSFKYIGLVE